MVYLGGRRMGKEEIGKQIDSKKFSKTMRCYGDDKLGNIIKEKILPYKQYLLDFVSLKSDLSDFKINNIEKLPAIKWKIKNLQKLQSTNIKKFEEQYNQLYKYFEV